MYTISLVANKLGKNIIAFTEDFSYSQGNQNVLLKKAKITISTLFPRTIKITNIFSLFTKLVSIETMKTMRKGKFSVLSSERILEPDWMRLNEPQRKSVCNQALVWPRSDQKV